MKTLFLVILSLFLHSALCFGDSVQFLSYKIVIDSHAHSLGAYQLEIKYNKDYVKIVGLEGGQLDAFRDPPYYDRRGLRGGRIILAALANSQAIPPKGQTHVAIIHFAVEGDYQLDPSLTLTSAAYYNGKRFQPEIQFSPMTTEELPK